MKTQKTISKLITFSPTLYKLSRQRAEALGISFQEYIRHLLVNDTKDGLELVSSDEEAQVAQSTKDFEAGKYTRLNMNDKKQVNTFFGL